ncbi:hypothetical protein BC828DRAFT_382646 [Blastocladiella britannica]|nr:hypothetical protein BC828DRAFT_382646 [Blastocladiella britannica]
MERVVDIGFATCIIPLLEQEEYELVHAWSLKCWRILSQSPSVVAMTLTDPNVIGRLVARMASYDPPYEGAFYGTLTFTIESQMFMLDHVLTAASLAKRRDFFVTIHDAGFGRYLQNVFHECYQGELHFESPAVPFCAVVLTWLKSASTRTSLQIAEMPCSKQSYPKPTPSWRGSRARSWTLLTTRRRMRNRLQHGVFIISCASK